MHVDIAISLVAYRVVISDLNRVLDTLNHTALPITSAIIIIDNFGDANLEAFSARRGLLYYRSPANIGFGSGHNISTEVFKISSKVRLILNPDVYITSDSICECYKYLLSNHDVALVSPSLLSPDGRIQNVCRQFPTIMDILSRAIGHIFNPNRPTSPQSYESSKLPIRIPFVHGACLFIKSEYYLKIGGFDPRYFLYVEDADLCRRIWQLGAVEYLPHITATHLHGKASHKNLRLTLVHLKSFITYFKKWGWFCDKRGNMINRELSIKAGLPQIKRSSDGA